MDKQKIREIFCEKCGAGCQDVGCGFTDILDEIDLTNSTPSESVSVEELKDAFCKECGTGCQDKGCGFRDMMEALHSKFYAPRQTLSVEDVATIIADAGFLTGWEQENERFDIAEAIVSKLSEPEK